MEAARYVYFSFHRKNDLMRLQVVKNHATTKGGFKAAGYFDGSLEELAKKESDLAVKRAINKGFDGTTVTCVVIGSHTYQRRWVSYEIFKSIERGNGVFGVFIHNIKDLNTQQTCTKGPNVFEHLGLGYDSQTEKCLPYAREVLNDDSWVKFDLADPFPPSSAAYLSKGAKPALSSLFKVYDWVSDNGYQNFGSWVAAAAKQAGK